MRYLPVTEEEKRQMLQAIGAESIDALFTCIPESVRIRKEMNLPSAKSEIEIERHMASLGKENKGSSMLSFLGAGAYRHYQPSLIDQLAIRSEFYTCYTPYQPEVSQGTLQAIFEFQTMVTNLFDMDVANASMYDGASAAAEAAVMALKNSKKKNAIAVASTLHPQYIETIKTYTKSFADEIIMLEMDTVTGKIKDSELDKITENVAGVIFQYPNYFGVIEDVNVISSKAKAKGAFVIPVIIETTSLGVLTSPGEFDADIAVGEGQALGLPLNYGGPGVGLFAVKSSFVRKMPGRLVGKTLDHDGKDCFVLTLAAREQHIKREKATSNICSNQALMALMAGMYLATMGKEGLRKVALMNIARKEYLMKKIATETNAKIAFTGPTYNEFTILTPGSAKEVVSKMADQGILAGIPVSRYYPQMDNALIVNTTELHQYEDIDTFVTTLKKVIGG